MRNLASYQNIPPALSEMCKQAQTDLPPLPSAESVVSRMRMLCEEIRRELNQLHEVADRAFGAEPPAATNGTVVSPVAGAIDGVIQEMEGLYGSISFLSRRLSPLA